MQSKCNFLFKILCVALDKTLFPILLIWTRTLTFNQLPVQLRTHSRWGCLWICHLTRTLLPVCRSWQAFRQQFQLIQLHSSKQITISSLSFRNKPGIFLKAFLNLLLNPCDSNLTILKGKKFFSKGPWINKAQKLTLLGPGSFFSVQFVWSQTFDQRQLQVASSSFYLTFKSHTNLDTHISILMTLSSMR